jgi:hypothetical protein
MAQNGYVLLKQGEKVWHKHIDDLTHEDRQARIEYENSLVMWLKGRIAGARITEELHKNGRNGRV